MDIRNLLKYRGCLQHTYQILVNQFLTQRKSPDRIKSYPPSNLKQHSGTWRSAGNAVKRGVTITFPFVVTIHSFKVTPTSEVTPTHHWRADRIYWDRNWGGVAILVDGSGTAAALTPDSYHALRLFDMVKFRRQNRSLTGKKFKLDWSNGPAQVNWIEVQYTRLSGQSKIKLSTRVIEIFTSEHNFEAEIALFREV